MDGDDFHATFVTAYRKMTNKGGSFTNILPDTC